jgi:nitrite reductase (NO-forming)
MIRPTLVNTLFLAVAALILAVHAPTAQACPSCNDTFMHDLLENRADTAAGRDLLAAVANQTGLPLGPHGRRDSAPITAAAVAATRGLPAMFEGAQFIDVIERDEGLSIPPTSYVPQHVEPDVEFTISLDEGQVYIGQGVVYDGFLTDGKIPGPTLRVTEGDIVRFTVVNNGTIPHGASIHAADTQTSKYIGQIGPGETKSVTFRANVPGVYMYHCAPGGHAIPMHVLFGQYGMMVVEPKDMKYKLEEELGHGPDLTLYMLQHEFYASGKDAIEGNPLYTTFNGKLFRYVEDPIVARPGDYVRVYFLNVGPNLVSTFHLVGIIWDYVYWQGHPQAWMPGGQTVTAGPSDAWVIEFRVPPDEGAYAMVTHAFGSTTRGALGLLVADANANGERPKTVLADGPKHTPEEMAEIRETAVREISPYRPVAQLAGRPAKADQKVSFGADVDEVVVEIIGNSYYPKVIEIEPGTTVTWVNEDVFTYMAGEFSGVHNAVGVRGPQLFATRMLGHAESDSFTFTEPGEYGYICTPHPYMQGKIIVRERSNQTGL